jgi:hypothetical protein
MRHSLPAGYPKFDADGAEGHTLQLVRPKHHASVARLLADNKALATTGTAGAIARDFTAIGGVDVRTDLWVRMPHGTYYAFDPTSAYSAKAVAVLHVGGDYVVASHPHVGGVVTAVGEMS